MIVHKMDHRRSRTRVVLLCLVVLFSMGSVFAQDDNSQSSVHTNPDSSESTSEAILYQLPRVEGRQAFFFEPFASGNELEGTRWVRSQSRKNKADTSEPEKYDGEWMVVPTNISRMNGDHALLLASAAKHHGIAARLDRPFSFSGKPFVFQYDVKFSNGQECGGAYVKLIQQGALGHLEDLHDKTPYTIMFGPDKCGKESHLRFIFQHRNPVTGKYEEKHWKEPSTLKIEELITSKRSHVYTLVVQPDNTFKVFVDQKIVGDGSLLTDVNPAVNPPAEVEDSNDRKPEDWDERKTIPDPDAVKPEDWDEEAPKKIPDPNAVIPTGWLEDEPEMIQDLNVKQPEDWDVEMDGEWEAPLIENPKCKGVGCGKWTAPQVDNPKCTSGGCGPWSRPMIDNPNYKGKWSPRKIANPEFFEDLEPYKMTPIDTVALELWSISNGVSFDNFLITDDISVADQIARQTWLVKDQQEGASESLLGGKVNYKTFGYGAAIMIGLITLLVVRGKRRANRMPMMPPMMGADYLSGDGVATDPLLRGSRTDADASNDTQTKVKDDQDKDDRRSVGAGDNAESASASAGSASEPEPEPVDNEEETVEKETKETGGARRRRPRRE